MIGTEPLDGQGDTARVGRWHREPGGAVAADAGPLHLVVQSLTPGGYAHLLVLHHPEGGHRASLASDGEKDAPTAMRAAERAVARAACISAEMRP